MGCLILADLYLCPREILEDEQEFRGLILEMLCNFGEECRQILINSGVGEGFMGLFKLDGARIGFQTFPSYEYLALEVYAFSAHDPGLYAEYLVEKVQPQVVSVREFFRAEHLQIK